MKLLNRLRNAWTISKLDDDTLDKLADETKDALEVLGDGKAVFLEAMTEDEITQYERMNEGWGGFIEKIKSIRK